MSVQAMSWALGVELLDPSGRRDPLAKFVLVALANYSDEFGYCWPSQKTLASVCLCSERKVRGALVLLERSGLIGRVNRRRPNGSWRSDAIVLSGFDGRIPLPEGDVHPVMSALHIVPKRNAGTSRRHSVPVDQRHRVPEDQRHHVPVPAAPRAALEPSVEPSGSTTTDLPPLHAVEMSCLDACGPGLCAIGREAIVGTSGLLGSWLEEGFDLDADILPIIRERTARERQTPIRTWDYFTEAIRAARRRRLARATSEASAEIEGHSEKPPGSEASAVDPVERLAAWINSDSYVPPSVINNTMRDELLARGLVTPEALRRRQIY